MGLLDRLDIAAADIVPRRYNKVGCDAEFLGTEEQEINTEKGVKIKHHFLWKTKEELTTTDGRKLAPGAIIKQERWVDTSNPQDLEGLSKDAKWISVALNKLKPTSADVPPVTDADIGKEARLWLTYQPSKTDPSDLSKGFQNFRVSPVKAS